MGLFDRYSQRARRVIFWSLHYARAAGSGYIEPEHILEGLLREDPQLFGLLQPERTNLVQSLAAALDNARQGAKRNERKDMPLSPTGKAVVIAAASEQKRLGHQKVATQHLLLAILRESEKPSGWFGKKEQTGAARLLTESGITSELVEEKTKNGIMTPATWVLDDVAISLNAQLAALAQLLIQKGLFSREEFVSLLDQNDGPLAPETFLFPLIDAIAKKGIITPHESAEIRGMTASSPQTKTRQGNDDSPKQS